MDIKVTSTAFHDGDMIPTRHTCDGADVSPPMAWTGVPQAAKSIAMVCEDPDAPGKTWVHWVIFNIPPSVAALPEAVPPDKMVGHGAFQGTNDSGKVGYSGPCPPSGTHRYYFRVLALDKTLDLEPGIRESELLKATQGHVIARGEMMGRYARK